MYPLVKRGIDVKRSVTSIQMIFGAHVRVDSGYGSKLWQPFIQSDICLYEWESGSIESSQENIRISITWAAPNSLFPWETQTQLAAGSEAASENWIPTFTTRCCLVCWWEWSSSLGFASQTALEPDAASLAYWPIFFNLPNNSFSLFINYLWRHRTRSFVLDRWMSCLENISTQMFVDQHFFIDWDCIYTGTAIYV